MAQHFSSRPSVPQPFSEAQDPALTSGMFWVRLLAYRPLFLLGGLWLALVCVSAIAYRGLMFNEPAVDTAHRDAPISIAAPLPQDLDPEAAPAIEPLGAEASQSSSVTLWALFSLVGLCAFGCFVLTQQIKAPPRPKRKKMPPVARAKPPARPPQPKRLTPYSPERDGVVMPGARVVEASSYPQAAAPSNFRPVASIARQAAPVPRANFQSRPQPAEQLESALQPRTPAVVPDEADLALDWSEGSVAHALDMRQRRSLSSFM